jgi:hypothetical protein
MVKNIQLTDTSMFIIITAKRVTLVQHSYSLAYDLPTSPIRVQTPILPRRQLEGTFRQI